MLSKLRFWFGMGAGSLALLVSGAFAQEPAETGFYLNADLGPAWREKVDIKRFLNVQNPGSFGFDTGIRFDVAAGYQILPWLGAEFETGVVANNIEDQGDSSLSSVPLMFNIVAKKKLWDRVTPFAGAGVGGAINTLWADDIAFYNNGNPVIVDGEDSDFVFGWQGFVGTKFAINDNWDISLTYRYMWVDESSYDVQPFFAPEINDAIKLGSSEMHAVVLGMTFRF